MPNCNNSDCENCLNYLQARSDEGRGSSNCFHYQPPNCEVCQKTGCFPGCLNFVPACYVGDRDPVTAYLIMQDQDNCPNCEHFFACHKAVNPGVSNEDEMIEKVIKPIIKRYRIKLFYDIFEHGNVVATLCGSCLANWGDEPQCKWMGYPYELSERKHCSVCCAGDYEIDALDEEDE